MITFFPQPLEGDPKPCHCGNPSDLIVDGHCWLCRCDEHSTFTTSPSMCGPACMYHDDREQRLRDLHTRAYRQLPPNYTPADVFARTYHPWAEIPRRRRFGEPIAA